MAALLLSIFALGVAPLVDRPLGRSPRMSVGLDAATTVVIAGVVFLQVLPHGIVELGWPAVLAAALGLLTPLGCDRVSFGEGLIRALAGVALTVHGLLDGAALAAEGAEGEALSAAVVLHSLPMGLAVWRAVSAHGGRGLAAGMLAVSALSEAIGWAFAPALAGRTGDLLALAQCFVAGSLLHLVGHGRPLRGWPSGLGTLVGVGLTLVLLVEHPLSPRSPAEWGLGEAFFGLAGRLAPALGLGLGLTALLAGKRPAWTHRLLDPASPLQLAALLPSLALLGGPLTLLRCAAALRWPRREPGPLEPALGAPLLWTFLGLGVAALLEALLRDDALIDLPWGLALFLGALLPSPLAIGPAALGPIGAILLHKGLDPGGVVAFLVAAPLGGRPDGEAWAGTLRRLGAVVGLAVLVGALGHLLLPAGVPSHDDLRGDGPLTQAAIALCGLALGALLLRLGLSGLLQGLGPHPAGAPAEHAVLLHDTDAPAGSR